MCNLNLILEKQPSEEERWVYVEFGAGRAGLSSFVAAKLVELDNKSNVFLAIDRDSRRFKLDKQYKDIMTTFREKLDISDFDLKTFLKHKKDSKELTSDQDLKLLAIAKHLCGGATDLSLTSMSLQDPSTIQGICIATCCHQCCDAKTFVNLPFLKENGFTESDMSIIPRLTSWAICLQTEEKKRRIGFKVKRILDYARIIWIEKTFGLDVQVRRYCDPLKESPECILLLGFRPAPPN